MVAIVAMIFIKDKKTKYSHMAATLATTATTYRKTFTINYYFIKQEEACQEAQSKASEGVEDQKV